MKFLNEITAVIQNASPEVQHREWLLSLVVGFAVLHFYILRLVLSALSHDFTTSDLEDLLCVLHR